jgi:plastocyanin
MRTARLLAPTLIAVLALAAPAGAEDQSVAVSDYEFNARNVSIDVGDTITWNFVGPTEHTSSSNPGQPEKWESGLKGVNATFTHTFSKPGKFQYFCQPHPYMKGAITVGEDAAAKSFTKAKLKGGDGTIKVTVTLKETAKVTLSAKRKKVSKRLKAGKRTLTLRKVKAGSYTAKVVAQDDFDKKTTKSAKVSVS